MHICKAYRVFQRNKVHTKECASFKMWTGNAVFFSINSQNVQIVRILKRNMHEENADEFPG